MKQSTLLFRAFLAVMMLAAVPVAFAQDDAEAKEEGPKGVKVTVTGTNYCLLNALAPDAMAEANADYALLNGLKVTEALDEEGNAIEGMAGKTLHYVPSKGAQELLVGEAHQGATVTVTGTVYVDASSIVVDSFTAESGGDDWDELSIGSMSGQAVL
jgi:hypothetical protein